MQGRAALARNSVIIQAVYQLRPQPTRAPLHLKTPGSRHFSISTNVRDVWNLAKQRAARAAVDSVLDLKRHRTIGIGSGSTIVFVAQEISKSLKSSGFDLGSRTHEFVPTGWQSKKLCVENGLPVVDVQDVSNIDITFDGADDVDHHCNVIKGGGACLLQEKIVMRLSNYNVVVADERKDSAVLSQGVWQNGVPLEVVPQASALVTNQLQHAFGSTAKVTPRQGGKSKAGPVVTDTGNFVLDIDLPQDVFRLDTVAEVEKRLKLMTGVVDAGLFTGLVDEVFFGRRDSDEVKRVRRIRPERSDRSW
ncbi:hypothetical protein ACM66B_000064 [Microbotryomycetes sp. NB124-2]